jgi:hypothetical protein
VQVAPPLEGRLRWRRPWTHTFGYVYFQVLVARQVLQYRLYRPRSTSAFSNSPARFGSTSDEGGSVDYSKICYPSASRNWHDQIQNSLTKIMDVRLQ